MAEPYINTAAVIGAPTPAAWRYSPRAAAARLSLLLHQRAMADFHDWWDPFPDFKAIIHTREYVIEFYCHAGLFYDHDVNVCLGFVYGFVGFRVFFEKSNKSEQYVIIVPVDLEIRISFRRKHFFIRYDPFLFVGFSF